MFLTLLMSFSFVYSQDINVDRYVLYPTKNMWTFLKLDTSNGKIWQVQYTIEGPDYRFETSLNGTPLVLDDDRPSGRFKLYPTDNTYNFILIDTKIGTTYQVQWSQDSDNRAVIPISSSGALIWSCGYARVQFIDSWTYYDENMNSINAPLFDSCEDFHQGYAKVQKDGKSNYIDTTGKFLFDKWYDDCQKYDSQNLAWIRENGKENLLDSNQDPVLSRWYDKCRYKSNGYIEVCADGKYNLIDLSGKFLYAEWYDYIGYIDSKGLISVENNGKSNYLNLSGEVLLSEWFDYCCSFDGDYFKVKKDNKYNLIRVDGNFLLKDWYSYCGSIDRGLVTVSNDDKWNYVDIETGLPISEEWFDDTKSFNDEGFAEVKKGDTWYLIDKAGLLKEL